jgi:hypothetical protein
MFFSGLLYHRSTEIWEILSQSIHPHYQFYVGPCASFHNTELLFNGSYCIITIV